MGIGAVPIRTCALAVAVLGLPPPEAWGAPTASPPRDAAAELQERTAALMRGCRRCLWGVLIKELDGERVLVDHNGRMLFNPASNAKIATAAAALARLGAGYRFSTWLRGRVEGDRVVGGLYLQGGGDPSLLTADLAQMAQALQQRGIRTIEGPLFLDTSMVSARSTDPPGFAGFRSTHSFRAGVDALSLNGNVIRVTVAAGDAPGDLAAVSVDGQSDYILLRVTARTAGRTRLRVATFAAGLRTGVQVSGRIRLGGPPVTVWRRVHHPALYTGHALRNQLVMAGIQVGPAVKWQRTPADTPILVEHRSESLAAILRRGNKRSSNVVAELALLALGAETFGLPATTEKGRRAVRLYLADLGLRPGTYYLENGSGLSRRSRLRPSDLVTVLERAYHDPAVGPELLSSLPVAGLDGTLLHRFEGSHAAGFVRAKTGTLGGVTCLSGYAGYSDRRLVFSMLAARVPRQGPVRRLQAAMAESLVDYLRQRAGEPGRLEAPSASVVK